MGLSLLSNPGDPIFTVVLMVYSSWFVFLYQERLLFISKRLRYTDASGARIAAIFDSSVWKMMLSRFSTGKIS